MNDPVDLDFNHKDRDDELADLRDEWIFNRTREIVGEILSIHGYNDIRGVNISWETIDQALDDEALKQATREFNDYE